MPPSSLRRLSRLVIGSLTSTVLLLVTPFGNDTWVVPSGSTQMVVLGAILCFRVDGVRLGRGKAVSSGRTTRDVLIFFGLSLGASLGASLTKTRFIRLVMCLMRSPIALE